MPYVLKPGASMASEVRRVLDQQLQRAISELHAVGDPRSDDRIHEARRHVKKVRALIRLVHPVLRSRSKATQRRLRLVNRLLAPIADSTAVVDTFTRLGRMFRQDLSPQTLAAMRAGLLRREARLDEEARIHHSLRTASELLAVERKRVPRWTLRATGFRAVAPGLERGFRRARRAMAAAMQRPTQDSYHAWRRRVKDHWLQVRLIEDRCGNRLDPYRRRLEALDGCLGEYHDCAILGEIVRTDGIVSRSEAARCIRTLRGREAQLRRDARKLGHRIYQERAGHYVRRIRELWQLSKAIHRHAAVKQLWPRAA